MRTVIVVCLPLLVAGCATRPSTPARPASAAGAKPATISRTTAASTVTPATGAQRPSAETDGDEPGRAERREVPDLRPYDRVITKDAKSDAGVFTVHRVRDRVFYEIPKEMLGREFLWVSQIASTASGAGFGGQAAGNR